MKFAGAELYEPRARNGAAAEKETNMLRKTQTVIIAARLGMLSLLSVLTPSCTDDAPPGCRPGVPCQCFGGNCLYQCQEFSGCLPACASADSCSALCGDQCKYDCRSGTDCSATCTTDCAISCQSTSTCAAECGERCAYDCRDVSSCTPHVGPKSRVVCERVGSCQVQCAGDCVVDCRQTGACEVQCAKGAKLDCGNGRVACGSCADPV